MKFENGNRHRAVHRGETYFEAYKKQQRLEKREYTPSVVAGGGVYLPLNNDYEATGEMLADDWQSRGRSG